MEMRLLADANEEKPCLVLYHALNCLLKHSNLYEEGRLDKTGGLTVKTIRDIILVFRLSMEYAYKEKATELLNWDLVEYPKENVTSCVISLSKEEEQELIQCIYMHMK